MAFRQLIISCISLVICIQCFSQNIEITGDYKGKLPKVFKKLRNDYDLKFAFDNQLVKSIRIDQSFYYQTPEEVLEQMLLNTGLDFKNVEGTFVILKSDTKEYLTISFSGRIIDSESKEVLPFANIILKNRDIGTNSNQDGLFTFKNLENNDDTLVISYLGYSLREFSIKDFVPGSFNNFELNPIKQFLPTIEIVGNKALAVSIDKSVSGFSLNPVRIDEIPFSGAPDLFKSMQLLPGINYENETSSELLIRGGRSDENLILLDGFKVYNLDHFFGIYSAFNPDVIRQIKIKKSGMDASYGGRVSGLVDLTGREGNTLRTTSSLSVNFVNVNGLIETPIGRKTSFIVGFRRSHSDIYQSPFYQDLFNNVFSSSSNSLENGLSFIGEEIPDFFFYDLYSKVSFRPDQDNRLSVTFYRGQDNFEITDIIQRDKEFEIEQDINQYKSDWGNVGIGAIWSRRWNDAVYSKFSFGKSNFNRNYFNQITFRDEVLVTEQITSIDYSKSERSVLEDLTLAGELKLIQQKGDQVRAGFEQTFFSVTGSSNGIDTLSRSTQGYNDDANTMALWTSYQKLFGGFIFELGTRHTYYNRSDQFYWSPRIEVRKQLDENFAFKFSAGRYVQFIRRTNKQNLYLNQQERWFLADNDSIPIVRSTQISGGINYENDDWIVDFEGFIKNIDGNLLNRQEVQLLNFVIDENSLSEGFSNIGGFELYLQKKKGVHTGWASFTVSQSLEFYDDINDGDAIFSPNDRQFDTKLAYQYNLNQWQFSSNFIWHSGARYTPLLGIVIFTDINGNEVKSAQYGEEFSASVSDYISLNLSANYVKDYSWFNMKFGVSVNNILNRDNVKSLNYIPIFETRGELDQVEAREISLLGITPSVNIKFTFK